MNESEINKLIKDMAKKFKNGGFIDCLRGGGSVKDCGCGSKIEKAGLGKGDLGTSAKLPYYRPSRLEMLVGTLNKVPKHPRLDGLKGYVTAQILPNQTDTLTQAVGPYTSYSELRTPNGRFFEVEQDTRVNRYYDPSRPDRGVMRKPVPEGVLNMFNGIRSRFEPSPELKKCGGPLPKKSKLKK